MSKNKYTLLFFPIFFYLTIPLEALKLLDGIIGLLLMSGVMIEFCLCEAYNAMPAFFDKCAELGEGDFLYAIFGIYKRFALSSRFNKNLCRIGCLAVLLYGLLMYSSIIRTLFLATLNG